MNKEYESTQRSFAGLSNEINGSNCPASWKDIFILNTDEGRAYIVPSVSLILVEAASNRWVFRTFCGDFKPVANDPILDMIMDGIREFNVIPTTFEIELH